jgi:hypothetical protein
MAANVKDELQLLIPIFAINIITMIIMAILGILSVDIVFIIVGCAYLSSTLALILAKSGNIILRLVINISSLLLIALIIAPNMPIIIGCAIIVAIIITITGYRTPMDANDTNYSILVKQQTIIGPFILIPLILISSRHLLKIYEIDSLIALQLSLIQNRLKSV